MNNFTRKPREGVGAVIGIAGATGVGKTLSALRIARGLAALPGEALDDPAALDQIDGRIAYIDTERRRALHYQVAAGELPQPFRRGHATCFRFAHAELAPPYEPDAYKRLIAEADEAGFRVVVVDSFSHAWDGDGGCHDMHAEDQFRAFEEAKRRAADRNGGDPPRWWNDSEQMDKLNIGAWRRPKMLLKKFVSRLLQCNSHVIVCMRAEDKLRIETVKEEGRNGREYTKTKITAAADMAPKDRWAPVCERRFPFELLTSFVLTPDAPGVPVVLKMHEDHRAFIRDGEPLDERFGQAVAAWAGGQKRAEARPVRADDGFQQSAPPAVDFPGDRPPRDPYSDAPPANAVWLGVDWYDPAKPRAIPLREVMSKQDWQQWAKAFRDLTENAPGGGLARAWKTANTEALLKLAALSPAAHSAAIQYCPPDLTATQAGEEDHGQETSNQTAAG